MEKTHRRYKICVYIFFFIILHLLVFFILVGCLTVDWNRNCLIFNQAKYTTSIEISPKSTYHCLCACRSGFSSLCLAGWHCGYHILFLTVHHTGTGAPRERGLLSASILSPITNLHPSIYFFLCFSSSYSAFASSKLLEPLFSIRDSLSSVCCKDYICKLWSIQFFVICCILSLPVNMNMNTSLVISIGEPFDIGEWQKTVSQWNYSLKLGWVMDINCFWEVKIFRVIMWGHPPQPKVTHKCRASGWFRQVQWM